MFITAMRFREEPEERVSELSRITPRQTLHSGNDIFENMSRRLNDGSESSHIGRAAPERANNQMAITENVQAALATREGGRKQLAESFIAFLESISPKRTL